MALALGEPCGSLSRRRDEDAEATEGDAARMVEECMMEAAHWHAGWQPGQGITALLIGAEMVRKLKVGLSNPDPDCSGDQRRVLCSTPIVPQR